MLLRCTQIQVYFVGINFSLRVVKKKIHIVIICKSGEISFFLLLIFRERCKFEVSPYSFCDLGLHREHIKLRELSQMIDFEAAVKSQSIWLSTGHHTNLAF